MWCDGLVISFISIPSLCESETFVSHNVCPPLLRTADLLSVKIVKMLELNCETWRGRGCAWRGSGSDTGGRRRRWGGTCRASQLRPHTGLGSLNEEQKRPIYCCMLRPLATFEYTDMRRNGHSFPPWQIRCPILKNHLAFGLRILDTGLSLLSVED